MVLQISLLIANSTLQYISKFRMTFASKVCIFHTHSFTALNYQYKRGLNINCCLLVKLIINTTLLCTLVFCNEPLVMGQLKFTGVASRVKAMTVSLLQNNISIIQRWLSATRNSGKPGNCLNFYNWEFKKNQGWDDVDSRYSVKYLILWQVGSLYHRFQIKVIGSEN